MFEIINKQYWNERIPQYKGDFQQGKNKCAVAEYHKETDHKIDCENVKIMSQ